MSYDQAMEIYPRLNEIDDCLYRVAIRALVVNDNRVLLVWEVGSSWWQVPGGGVDYGETVQSTLIREVEEELGVAAKDITSDGKIAYYDIGNVINGVPRMNLYYKVSVPGNSVKKTKHVSKLGWFTKDEFLKLNADPSYAKSSIVQAIFG